MKSIRFFINSNIFIALAAVCLVLATQVQLGLHPRIDVYVALIFFAVLFDYNLHRLISVKRFSGSVFAEKYRWASDNLIIIKFLILISLAGIAISAVFVNTRIFYLLGLLAIITFLYSAPFSGKLPGFNIFSKLAGIKTIMIAFVWTAATALITVFAVNKEIDTMQTLLICIERFAFIFAIAIPFDVRDMETDRQAGIRTIPIAFGPERALLIGNLALILSLSVAVIHYLSQNMVALATAFVVSILSTLVFTNSKRFKSLPLYHHGILDGCIALHGILICASCFS